MKEDKFHLPTLVVVAYNRPDSLSRLLNSLKKAAYPQSSVRIIISIDYSGNSDVVKVAKSFNWLYGPKDVIEHPKHLGLKNHILYCGSLSQTFGSVIILEDDLMVSTQFYRYAMSAKSFYSEDSSVAGISLYRYYFTEHYLYPFFPIRDGSDVHFIQMASSWGQLFTDKQWTQFYSWYAENPNLSELAPAYIHQYWSDDSWKKHYVDYLINNDKFFVFPNESYTTNFHEYGSNSKHIGLFQVEMATAEAKPKYVSLQNSLSVYDGYFELLPNILKRHANDLRQMDLATDLYGTKPLDRIESRYLLSSKKCLNPIISFAFDLPSPIQNVFHGLKGDFFSLGLLNDFTDTGCRPMEFHKNFLYMKDVLFAEDTNSKIVERAEALLEEWKPKAYESMYSSMTLNHHFPRIFCGVIEQTLEDSSINEACESFQNDYPSSQITYKRFTYKNTVQDIVQAIDASMAEYYVIFNSEEFLAPKALVTINQIFQKYSDILWLTGIQTVTTKDGFQLSEQSTAARRWNEYIYGRTLYGQTGRFIAPGATFFKRALWNLAHEELNIISLRTFCDDLWKTFFKYGKLYTVDAYLSSTRHSKSQMHRYHAKSELVETKALKKLSEWLFLRNIPVFRSYYKEYNELPPVVRYDFKTQSHWLSEY